jgi:putative SOS response-associated peptidase YedK
LNDLLAEIGLQEALEYAARYNIAPTQQVPIVVGGHAKLARWGLVPAWANDPKIGNSLINARADTVADKPSFRSAFKRGRCLVLADGFYEWQKVGKAKQPYFIHRRDNRPFAFAGLTEHWTKGPAPLDTFTIITTEPNSLMAGIHDRMPVILPREAWGPWLDAEFQGKDELRALLRPYEADDLIAEPVSTLVNSPKNDVPQCVEPLAE